MTWEKVSSLFPNFVCAADNRFASQGRWKWGKPEVVGFARIQR